MSLTPKRVDALDGAPPWLGLDNWNYSAFFDRIPKRSAERLTGELDFLVAEACLDQHPFFGAAERSLDVLSLWVSQELVMTNAFSQLVLSAASRIQNVHTRAVLAEIAYGEHGKSRRQSQSGRTRGCWRG